MNILVLTFVFENSFKLLNLSCELAPLGSIRFLIFSFIVVTVQATCTGTKAASNLEFKATLPQGLGLSEYIDPLAECGLYTVDTNTKEVTLPISSLEPDATTTASFTAVVTKDFKETTTPASIEDQLNEPNIWDDVDKANQINMKLTNLKKEISSYNKLNTSTKLTVNDDDNEWLKVLLCHSFFQLYNFVS